MKTRAFLVVASFLFGVVIAAGQGQNKTITTSEAKNHIGETESVCGRVASARYAATSKGEPTFLNLDVAYPHEIFTIVIWGNNRPQFRQPEVKYANANVCVTGTVESYGGTPEIIASSPSQIVTGRVSSSSSQSSAAPSGATAQCRDGSYSFSQHRQGTCSHHGGVAKWL